MVFIQILGIAFAVFAISIALQRYKLKRISLKSLLIWCVIWIGVIVIALLPSTMGFTARLLGIGRGIDVIVYLSIILLYYLIFRIYIMVEDTKKDITKLVRELAIRKKKK